MYCKYNPSLECFDQSVRPVEIETLNFDLAGQVTFKIGMFG